MGARKRGGRSGNTAAPTGLSGAGDREREAKDDPDADDTAPPRFKRRRGGSVKGRHPHKRLDKRARRADGGSTEDFAAAEDHPDDKRKRIRNVLPDSRPLLAGEDGGEDGHAAGGGIHIKASHKGLLHKELGVPEGKPIPAAKLAKAKNSSDPAERKRATFAANAKKWHHGG